MRAIGNFLWFVLGGFAVGALWYLIGIIAFVSVVGIPWGRACFVIGNLSCFPFGREAIDREALTLRRDIGTGIFGSVGNIIWFFVAGFWLALLHVAMALAYFVTIVGIPGGFQHLKLAGLSLAPIGKTIVSVEMADEARRQGARTGLAKIRGG
jgi:uncharacterized membrane protein YccF (DUF307 family)